MMDIKDIVVGDKADLYFENIKNSPYYKTQVQEITEDGHFAVFVPAHKGVPIVLRDGQELAMCVYRDNGRFTVDVRVARFLRSEKIQLVELEPRSALKKEQRREYYRLPVSLRAEALSLPISVYTEVRSLPETLPKLSRAISYEDAVKALEKVGVAEDGVSARDISISGLSIRTKTAHELGDQMVVKVHLGWPNEKSPPISAVVEVRRVEYDSANGVFAIGVEFVGAFAMRDLITKYIFEQQKRRIKQQKLVEDD
ncbi:MAG: flagellar brake protein [Oscillospiraceae bacterium]|jgi:c-di-GMP-binding flagellar brake protein YcgR|nr:flagellar brake protein [Oscillospiraceae bacterium]